MRRPNFDVDNLSRDLAEVGRHIEAAVKAAEGHPEVTSAVCTAHRLLGLVLIHYDLLVPTGRGDLK